MRSGGAQALRRVSDDDCDELREVSKLRRRVEKIQQRLRQTSWDRAVTDLRAWADRVGLPTGEAPTSTAIGDAPPSREVRLALAEGGSDELRAVPAAEPDHGPIPDRRQHGRVPVGEVLRFATGEGASTCGVMGDLSLGGMFVRSERVLFPGTTVACGFYVRNGRERELVLVRGVVAWAKASSSLGSRGFGVRFTRMTVDPAWLVFQLTGAAPA